MAQMLAAMPEEQRKQIQQLLGPALSDPTKLAAIIDDAIAKSSDTGLPPEIVQQLEAAKIQIAAMAAAAADQAPAPSVVLGQGFLIAVQDPTGSYLLGWQAAESGGNFLFSNTPANSAVRPRASAWDGIGDAGFSDTLVAAADDVALPNAAPPSDAPSADTPGAEPAPSGPTQKSTPSGPVTIPGG